MENVLQCKLFPAHLLENLKYVVVCSWYKGQWLFSRKKGSDAWETQGGHIEPGETPEQAARRELYEESGVQDAVLYYVCDYIGYDAFGFANGAVFFADVNALGALPESEMEEAKLFDSLPEKLAYPRVTPVLLEKIYEVMYSLPDNT